MHERPPAHGARAVLAPASSWFPAWRLSCFERPQGCASPVGVVPKGPRIEPRAASVTTAPAAPLRTLDLRA
ncbi:MAG: hypothetical protein ACO3JL_21195, partial [Myxococcota bacterium]